MKTTTIQPTGWAFDRIKAGLEASAQLKLDTATQCKDEIFAAAVAISLSFQSDGKMLLCGNGGSAADCQHLAAEFVSRLTQDFPRAALPAIALTTDTSFLTAFTNDCGYDGVFARQIEALGIEGDILFGISTSGNSKNVVEATKVAQQKKMTVIALCGEGGHLKELADIAICVPSTSTARIQETHLTIEHIVCELVERFLFEKGRMLP